MKRLVATAMICAAFISLADGLPYYVTITNDVGKVLTIPRPGIMRPARIHSHGATYEIDHYGNVKVHRPVLAPNPEERAMRIIALERRIAMLTNQLERLKSEAKNDQEN